MTPDKYPDVLPDIYVPKEKSMYIEYSVLPLYAWGALYNEKTSMIDEAIHMNKKVLDNPELWNDMNYNDWYNVHAPARVVAFRNIIKHWCDYYKVGKNLEYMTDLLTAVMIRESYLEHDAAYDGPDSDIGISQVSPWMRERLHEFYRDGINDFYFSDEDYFDPNKSIRAGVWLFNYILEKEAHGNTELAVRAYNQGIKNAKRGTKKSREYYASVKRIMDNCNEKSDTTLCMSLNRTKEQ